MTQFDLVAISLVACCDLLGKYFSTFIARFYARIPVIFKIACCMSRKYFVLFFKGKAWVGLDLLSRPKSE